MGAKGTTKSQGKKHELDKFYTKEPIVEKCLSYFDFGEYDCYRTSPKEGMLYH